MEVCGGVIQPGAVVRDVNLENCVTARVCDKGAQKNMTCPLEAGRTALENHLLLECLRECLKRFSKRGELGALRVSVLPGGVAVALNEYLDVWRVVARVVVLVYPKSQ